MGCCSPSTLPRDIHSDIFSSLPVRSINILTLLSTYIPNEDNGMGEISETQFQSIINEILLTEDIRKKEALTSYWLDFYRNLPSLTRTITIKMCLFFLSDTLDMNKDIELVSSEMLEMFRIKDDSNCIEVSRNETKKILASYVKLLTIDTVELFRGLIDERTFERDLKQRWEIKAVDKFVDMTFFKSQYDKKGMYNGYDKKNKEREALDYYSTPTEEVTNILNILNIDFNDKTILEPCAGGGHMLKAIHDYINDSAGLIATDIKKRTLLDPNLSIETGKEFDFLSDNYPYTEDIDYIIMNPPYAVIEPFVMKSLSIANKGIIMLGRLQFLEGEARYKNIFMDRILS